MTRPLIIAIGLAAIAGASSAVLAESHHHWSYFGEGAPSHWAELDPKNAACGMGKNQSPIDIRTHDLHPAALPALKFDYKPDALHIIDNGHTVQVNVDPGNFLLVGDQHYELVQFHFHHPSEELVNGKGFDMEAHLVHRDAKGHLAVVAVLLRPGQPNAMIDTLWHYLPKQKELQVDQKAVRIDITALIPPDHAYYSYTGSLTTPPCSEGVRWFVLKSPRTLSQREIATFAGRYPNDARPVQKLNGREVLATK